MPTSSSITKTRRLAVLAMLTAIVAALQVFTTFLPTKPFAVTLALVPIVVGAALYGVRAGAYLGGVFSVVVIIFCITGHDAGGAMVWAANPFLCVLLCMLKGCAAGAAAGLVYKALSGKNQTLAVIIAAFVSPIVNTGIFICGMAIFFRDLLVQWAGGSNVLYFAIIGMTGLNFVAELVVNMILSPAITRIIAAVKKTDK